jgi:branched-chain amino acid transport system substrate-binding protein
MLALAGTLAFAVAGCGTHRHSVALPGPALTIYTSLPLDAEDGARAQDVAAAERLALEQAGGRAGGFRIALVVLDDATTATGTWDPGLTQLNARRAADDPTTIAYLGELSGGASADSLLGLTRNGGSPGEPERYYPTGQRTFARLVPSDEMQAEAISRYMMAEHVRRLLVLDDQGNEGASLGLRVARGAALHHIDVVDLRAIDPHATDFSSLAASVAAAHVDAICFAGDSTSMAPLLFNQLAAADPSLRLFG